MVYGWLSMFYMLAKLYTKYVLIHSNLILCLDDVELCHVLTTVLIILCVYIKNINSSELISPIGGSSF